MEPVCLNEFLRKGDSSFLEDDPFFIAKRIQGRKDLFCLFQGLVNDHVEHFFIEFLVSRILEQPLHTKMFIQAESNVPHIH